MNSDLHVASPPPKPLMIFDGDCRFCTQWIKRWQRLTGDGVDYLPFQDPHATESFPEVSRGQFQSAVHLIDSNGMVYSGAEAVYRALAVNPCRQTLLKCYQKYKWFAAVSERAYRFVAEHRPFFSWLTGLFWRN